MLLPAAAEAEKLRIAFYNTDLSRDGPGLLLRDILRDDDQARAVAAIVARVAPDILVLSAVDWDAGGHAMAALSGLFAAAGHRLDHSFTARPNSGLATPADLDGDGRTGGARDAQGYGRFTGQDGMVVLSRYPIRAGEVRDFSQLLWRDLPGGDPWFPGPEAASIQRLSSRVHWDVPVEIPGFGPLHLWIFHATPPVFDGPEDRNGRRNNDEALLWLDYLDQRLTQQPDDAPFVIVGDTNADPVDGDARRTALLDLLRDPRLQDPRPMSDGARLAGAGDPGQRGDPALDTVDWPETGGGPGNLRVSYILPDARLPVAGAGVFWPAPDSGDVALLGRDGDAASRHRLVWVDLDLQR